MYKFQRHIAESADAPPGTVSSTSLPGTPRSADSAGSDDLPVLQDPLERLACKVPQVHLKALSHTLIHIQLSFEA